MKTLLTEEEIQKGVTRLANEINETYGSEPLTIVGVLTGCVVLLADVIRQLEMPLRVGVVMASSYRGATTTRGELTINSDLMPDIGGRNVLIVDDIFDTGNTLVELMALMENFDPLTVRSAVLLRKHGRQEVDLEPDFIGFDIPNEFVVGYGLDYQDAYRNLPFVAALETAEIESCPP
ncbi:MAG: hypoxanthine phosphoribosyltransferase [Planctomycetota bacterium]